MKFSKLFLAVISAAFFVSCSDDDGSLPNVQLPPGSYDRGALILNQGNFNGGNASVSYLSSDFGTFQDNIFSFVNPDMELGDVASDIGLYNELAYIVVNNSDKIEVVNRYTMASIASITTGLDNPRYIAFSNGKGYVTNWGDGTNPADDYVAIIDLASNTISGAVSVIEGPEKIVENSGKLYVAHYGGFGFGSKISVINTASNAVTTTIAVGDLPNGLHISNGILWVSCEGLPGYLVPYVESAGTIVKVNLDTNAVVESYSYSDVTKHIFNFVIDETNAFYTMGNAIYKFPLDSAALPADSAFSTQLQDVDNISALAVKANSIYVADALGFTGQGKVHVYSLGINGETLGNYRISYTVGVGPSGFYFNF